MRPIPDTMSDQEDTGGRAEWPLALLIGALAALPGLLPGAEHHLDNSPHALELQLLASEVLPVQHWVSGWSPRANAGTAVFQLNAPLAWLPLALLVQLGLGLEVAIRLGAPVANAVVALGAWALARRLFVMPGVGLLAAALAASTPMDLVGVGGALGGMWPHRLANGVLLLGLAAAPQQRRPAAVALWLALIGLLHTFTALFAAPLLVARAALHLRAGQRHDALNLLVAVAVAGLLISPQMGPLLDARLRSLPAPWQAPLPALAHLLFVPVDLIDLRLAGSGAVLGGLAGALQSAALWAGAAIALFTGAARARSSGVGVGLGVAVLVWTAVALVCQGAGFELLGPNPWRHLAITRLGLALTAAVGLAAVLPALGRRIAVVAAVCAGGAIGLNHLASRLDPEVAHSLDDLQQTWIQVAAAHPEARVYQVDTFRRGDAPPGTEDIHPGGLEAAQTGLSLLGSWYGISPDAVVNRASSELGLLMGAPEVELTDLPGWIDSRMMQLGATAFITHRAAHRAALESDGRFKLIADTGSFTAWARTGPTLPLLGVKSPATAVEGDASPTRIESLLVGTPPLPFRVRVAYHPWWQGSVNGDPVPLTMTPDTGMLQGVSPQAGDLVLTWTDHGVPWRWTGAGGALLLVLLALRDLRARSPLN
ncbi:hypothetical protein L6R46_22175 [Myxococcota bacterium]|nr:hypothetical protein [Myxococcota bacterium]